MNEEIENTSRALGGLGSLLVALPALILGIGLGIALYWVVSPAGEKGLTASTQPAHGHQAEAATVWTCSMHPEIALPRPGPCPKCGMDLIPRKAAAPDAMGGMRVFTTSENAKALMNIQTAAVERLFPTAEIRMVGKVEYDETRLAYITAWVPGRLDRLFVDYTGIAVKKGDHMVYVYSPELYSAQEELLQALKAVQSLQRSDVDIVRKTAEATVGASREKLRLLGLTDEQVARMEKRGKAEDHVTIYAPVSGIVIHKNAQEGMYVQTGTRVYTIADLSQVWVKLDAYESDLSWLRYGQKVEFTTISDPGETFTGTISFIAPLVNPATRTVQVRVNVPNAHGKLKPEMFVKAKVYSRIAAGGRAMEPHLAGKWICPMHPEVVKDGQGKCDVCGMDLVTAESLGYVSAAAGEKDKPLVIPVSAALVTGTRAIVYVKEPDKEKPTFVGREIVLGPRAGDWYIVRRGLAEGEQVVTRGNFKIDSALQIQARPSMMTPDGGGPPSGAARLPGLLAQQLRQVLSAAGEAQKAAMSDDLVAARAAFGKLTGALSAVDANQGDHNTRMMWKELSMRLGNDADEGAAATTTAALRNTARPLAANAATLASWFGLSTARIQAPVEPLPAELRKQVDAVFESYFAASAGLAADDPNAARAALADMTAAIAKVDMKLFGPAGHKAWMSGKGAMGKALSQAALGEGIHGLRVAFEPLSNAAAALARRLPPEGPKAYYRLHCPMAFDGRGADWLQRDQAVLNPYFGASMLRCGSVEEVIRRPDEDPPASAPAEQSP